MAVIPVNNEESTISDFIKNTKIFVDELIVVNDGSNDRTAELAKNAGALVLNHKYKLGKWSAQKTGLHWSLKLLSNYRYVLDVYDFIKRISNFFRSIFMKKFLIKNIYDVFSIFLLIFNLFLTIYNWKYQLRGDIANSLYHLLIGKMYYTHGFINWDIYQFAPLGRPHLYPPLYHVIIMILKILSIEFLDCARLISIIQWMGGLASTWYFSRKIFSKRIGLISLILISNIELFWNWQGSAMPSSLCTVLFPAILYYFWNKKIIISTILFSILIWLHLGLPYIFMLCLLLFSFWKKDYLNNILKIIFLTLLSFSPWIIRLYLYRDWIKKLTITIPFWANFLPLNIFITIFFFYSIILKENIKNERIHLLIAYSLGSLPIIFTYGGYRHIQFIIIPVILISSAGLDRIITKINYLHYKLLFIILLMFSLSIFEVSITTEEYPTGMRGTDLRIIINYAPLLRGILGIFGSHIQRLDFWNSQTFLEYDELIKWIFENTEHDEILYVFDTRLALYISLQTNRRIDKGMFFEIGSREMYEQMAKSWYEGRIYILPSDKTYQIPNNHVIEEHLFGNIKIVIRKSGKGPV